jgi:cyclopropane fatty-acyl-phospholipid synthase-like methyltransferase
VESDLIKPGRAVVLGCGTGTNAIYLAQKGFDVTAIDIAPTALNLAEEKAKKANVAVRWLLADVLAPPAQLEPFAFLFDRGCYHGVRRGNARGYVEAVKQLSRSGTQMLILAGNANEERHYGPPRVTEEELRADFSADFDFVGLDTVRFDSTNPNVQGALAWLVLLRRSPPSGSQ